jgi:hypothetical protein
LSHQIDETIIEQKKSQNLKHKVQFTNQYMTSPNVIGQNASKMFGQSQKLDNANN